MPATQRGRPMTPQEQDALQRELAQNAQPTGPVSRDLVDLPNFGPEISQVDALEFAISIPTTGVVTAATKLNLPAHFYCELAEIRGFMQNPGTDPELLPLVTMNLRDESRTRDVFTSDLRMASFVGTLGQSSRGLVFPRGRYVFDPKAQVWVRFATLSGYSAAASEAKIFGVQVFFNLYGG